MTLICLIALIDPVQTLRVRKNITSRTAQAAFTGERGEMV